MGSSRPAVGRQPSRFAADRLDHPSPASFSRHPSPAIPFPFRVVGSLKRAHLCLFSSLPLLLIASVPLLHFAVMGDPRPFTREISIDILRGAVRMKKGLHGTAGVSFEELVSSESNLQRLRQTACQSRNTTDIRLELFRLRARWERLCELIYESARFIGSFEDLDHHMIDLPTDEYIRFRKVILISYLIYVFNKFVVLIHLSSICEL